MKEIRELCEEYIGKELYQIIISNPKKDSEALSTHSLILMEVANDPCITIKQLASKLDLSQRSVERHISKLVEDGTISKSGFTHRGPWIITSDDNHNESSRYASQYANSLRASILSMLIEDPGLTTRDLSRMLGVSQKSVERRISDLKRENILARSGSTRRGQWVVRMDRE